MKAIHDPANALAAGLEDIRTEHQLPKAFPPDVLAEAEAATARMPVNHADWSDRHFVTLDPAPSRDLDQAFSIELSGSAFLLHYAIADIGWFVEDGSAIDAEAWQRGMTLYLPGARIGLYPPTLSENAASLLPDGSRPAIIFTVRIDEAGEANLEGATRAIIRSRAKLAYDSVTTADLPDGFSAIAARMASAETRRGAARIDPPEQELSRRPDGQYELSFRPRLQSEADNAALSLAANMAIAKCLFANRTGLFRVMAEPDAAAIIELRHSARALGLDWAEALPLADFEKSLDPSIPGHAAFALAIRRAGERAAYAPFDPNAPPWHAAIAAPYAHATAPLRRLADRYVNEAVLSLCNGLPVPDTVTAAFAKLPPVMARAEAKAGQIERAAIDLAEAVMLQGHVGQSFKAIITGADEKRTRIQLCDQPILASLAGALGKPGDIVCVRLDAVDVAKRKISFVV